MGTRIALSLLSSIAIALTACSRPQIDKRYKDEWHGSCKVAAFWLPVHLGGIHLKRKHELTEHTQIGTCTSRQIQPSIWHATGTWQNAAMHAENVPALSFEALMYESTDSSDSAVRMYGPQFEFCSLGVDGIDRSAIRPGAAVIKLDVCGEANDLIMFKARHGL